MSYQPVITETELLDAQNWRYATKQFDPIKKIPEATWDTLERTLILTPSSFGLQPWRFFVVTNPEIREKLVGVSWGQRQVADCSHLVVFALIKNLGTAHLDRYMQRTADVRGAKVEDLAGFRNVILGSIEKASAAGFLDVWQSRQLFIALGNLMTSAALLGIDTCPMEGFEPEKVDEVLGLTERGLTTLVMCPVGYRAAEDKYATLPKVRFEAQDIIEHIA